MSARRSAAGGTKRPSTADSATASPAKKPRVKTEDEAAKLPPRVVQSQQHGEWRRPATSQQLNLPNHIQWYVVFYDRGDPDLYILRGQIDGKRIWDLENRQKDLSLYPMYCYGTNSGPTLDSNGRITEKGRKEVFENKDYDADVDEPAAPRLFLTETVAQAKGLTGANIWTKKSRERCINIFRNDLFNAIRRASFNSARFVLPDVPLADPDKSNNKIKTEASEDGASQVQSPAATPSKRSKNTRKPKQSGVTGATSAPAASSSTTGAIPPLPQVTTLSIIPDNPIRSILGQKRGGHISKFKDLSIRDLSQMEYESIARTMQEVWITEEMPPIDVLRKAREEAYIFRGRLPVLLAPTMLTWLTQQSTPQDIDPYVDEDATTVSQSLLKLQLGDAWDESDLLHLTKNLW